MDEFKNSSNNYKDTENERKDRMEKTTSTGTTNNCTENEGRDIMEKTTSTGTTNNGTENEGRDTMEKKHGDKSPDNTNGKNGTVHNKEKNMATKKNCGFKTTTARELQDFISPQKNFIVEGLITHGLNLLAGPKKHGKSMLALNLALCIAGKEDFFGRKTEHGDVLYMALEDTKERSRDRLNTMVDDENAPETLKCYNKVVTGVANKIY